MLSNARLLSYNCGQTIKISMSTRKVSAKVKSNVSHAEVAKAERTHGKVGPIVLNKSRASREASLEYSLSKIVNEPEYKRMKKDNMCSKVSGMFMSVGKNLGRARTLEPSSQNGRHQ